MSTEELKAIIAHECAHIQNKDSIYRFFSSPIFSSFSSIVIQHENIKKVLAYDVDYLQGLTKDSSGKNDDFIKLTGNSDDFTKLRFLTQLEGSTKALTQTKSQNLYEIFTMRNKITETKNALPILLGVGVIFNLIGDLKH